MVTSRRGLPLFAAFLLGLGLATAGARLLSPSPPPGGGGGAGAAVDDHGHEGEEGGTLYMCPMMCVEPQPEPGRCPVCGMDLVPMPKEEAGDAGPGPVLSMSEAAKALAEIRTSPVERRFEEMTLRLPGKIMVDETRVREISAWVAGRLEGISVDQTGTVVREGDPLVTIYSRELNREKAEYLATVQGDRSLYERGEQSQVESWQASARARLRLMGLTAAQIDTLEERTTPSFTDEILAPIGGTVIGKSAMEGMHVQRGSHLYTVADLSRLWVILDAYESDIPFLRYGQEVEVRTESYGDRVFRGTISFIDPLLDAATRTTRVRVIVDNEDGALKPNMFVRGRVRARVGASGEVLPGEALAGKWISPRHPEIVRDNPGDCPVCGIKLVRSESLGYAREDDARPPLLVPASSVLYTGRRSLVYLAVPDHDKPVYEGVEILIGPRVGDFYVVLDGLNEGDEVVTQGAFKIDSALQLVGKPSMMRPADDGDGDDDSIDDKAASSDAPEPLAPAPTAAAFRAALAEVTTLYFTLQEALAADDAQQARTMATTFQERLLAVPLDPLDGTGMETWTASGIGAYKDADAIARAEALAEQRIAFHALSAKMQTLLEHFGPLPGLTVYRAHCPMAFDDKGADWLQPGESIKNPYEGSRMPTCGLIKGELWKESP